MGAELTYYTEGEGKTLFYILEMNAKTKNYETYDKIKRTIEECLVEIEQKEGKIKQRQVKLWKR